ncbi:anti-sigma factor [Dokdonella soli]|uniref:Anti-sigma factor n=1 Tax=Dokdonella soli TaxID=529810 RepID=A0ABP3TP60_9GAMM
MLCKEAQGLVHAWLDDELDPARSLEMARHLDGCTACDQDLQRHAALKQALKSTLPYHAAPAALRTRLAAQLPREAQQRARRIAWNWAATSAALAAMLVIAIGVAGLLASRMQVLRADRLVADAVSSHVRSLIADHLIDVRSTDQHTVKPWFDGKLDFSPEVRDLGAQQFELVGGRLDVFDGARVAALVYRRRLHVVSLFEWPAAPSTNSGLIEDVRDGYFMLRWTDAGMHYAAVSNLNRDELNVFAHAFRNAAPARPAGED